MSTHLHGPQQDTPWVPEERDANIKLVVWTGVGILISVVICMVIGWLQFRFELSLLPQPEPGNVFSHEGRLPPGPRLQAFPNKDLIDFRNKATHKAEGYGWVDKEGGIAHVPVEKGIEIVLKNGLPPRSEAAKAAAKASAAAKAAAEAKKQ